MEVPWKSGCHALVWPVLCLFDLHYSSSWSIGEPPTVQCCSTGGAQQPIPCPTAQCAYQEFMGRVDLANQIQQSFSVIWKSNKAWKKLFYYGLEVCLLNSFTILKKVGQTTQDFLAFRIAIVRHFVEGKRFRGQPGRLLIYVTVWTVDIIILCYSLDIAIKLSVLFC